jgi:hypothetical protein
MTRACGSHDAIKLSDQRNTVSRFFSLTRTFGKTNAAKKKFSAAQGFNYLVTLT